MEAAPTSAVIMAKADLLFEFLIISFDPPSQLGLVDEVGEFGIFRQGREPVLGRLDLALGHSMRNHSSGRDAVRQ